MAPFRFITVNSDNTRDPSAIVVVQNGVQLKFSIENTGTPYGVYQTYIAPGFSGWWAEYVDDTEYLTESDVTGATLTIHLVYPNVMTLRSQFVINAYGRTFSEFTRTTYSDVFVINSDVVSAMLGYATPTRRRAAMNMQSLLAQQAQCLYFKR